MLCIQTSVTELFILYEQVSICGNIQWDVNIFLGFKMLTERVAGFFPKRLIKTQHTEVVTHFCYILLCLFAPGFYALILCVMRTRNLQFFTLRKSVLSESGYRNFQATFTTILSYRNFPKFVKRVMGCIKN
jgi:hypothetical protein